MHVYSVEMMATMAGKITNVTESVVILNPFILPSAGVTWQVRCQVYLIMSHAASFQWHSFLIPTLEIQTHTLLITYTSHV